MTVGAPSSLAFPVAVLPTCDMLALPRVAALTAAADRGV